MKKQFLTFLLLTSIHINIQSSKFKQPLAKESNLSIIADKPIPLANKKLRRELNRPPAIQTTNSPLLETLPMRYLDSNDILSHYNFDQNLNPYGLDSKSDNIIKNNLKMNPEQEKNTNPMLNLHDAQTITDINACLQAQQNVNTTNIDNKTVLSQTLFDEKNLNKATYLILHGAYVEDYDKDTIELAINRLNRRKNFSSLSAKNKDDLLSLRQWYSIKAALDFQHIWEQDIQEDPTLNRFKYINDQQKQQLLNTLKNILEKFYSDYKNGSTEFLNYILFQHPLGSKLKDFFPQPMYHKIQKYYENEDLPEKRYL